MRLLRHMHSLLPLCYQHFWGMKYPGIIPADTDRTNLRSVLYFYTRLGNFTGYWRNIYNK